MSWRKRTRFGPRPKWGYATENVGSARRRNQFQVLGWQPTGQYFLRYGHPSECPLSPCRAFVCEHAGRMPLTPIQSVVAWAHRSGSLLLVCHGMWMNPGSEGHLFNLVVPPSVVRSYHLHTRNEADMRVRLSANQGIRSSVTELLGSAL